LLRRPFSLETPAPHSLSRARLRRQAPALNGKHHRCAHRGPRTRRGRFSSPPSLHEAAHPFLHQNGAASCPAFCHGRRAHPKTFLRRSSRQNRFPRSPPPSPLERPRNGRRPSSTLDSGSIGELGSPAARQSPDQPQLHNIERIPGLVRQAVRIANSGNFQTLPRKSPHPAARQSHLCRRSRGKAAPLGKADRPALRQTPPSAPPRTLPGLLTQTFARRHRHHHFFQRLHRRAQRRAPCISIWPPTSNNSSKSSTCTTATPSSAYFPSSIPSASPARSVSPHSRASAPSSIPARWMRRPSPRSSASIPSH